MVRLLPTSQLGALREANMLYAEESKDFSTFYGTHGFLTQSEWQEQLGSMRRE